MARLQICAGNWKMNASITDAINYFVDLQKMVAPQKTAPKKVIFPQAFCLGYDVQAAAEKSGFKLGSQNCHSEEKGAFTGELSASSLKQIGIEWTLIGHSERRQFFGETFSTAANRANRALRSGMNVIFCVGESLAERESSQTEKVLEQQMSPLWPFLREVEPSILAQDLIFSIAYEPVWAIGTGKTASPEQAEAAHAFLREQIQKNINSSWAEQTPILYGGSVTPENARSLCSKTGVDGFLVGGASLKPESFSQILASLQEKR